MEPKRQGKICAAAAGGSLPERAAGNFEILGILGILGKMVKIGKKMAGERIGGHGGWPEARAAPQSEPGHPRRGAGAATAGRRGAGAATAGRGGAGAATAGRRGARE
ncbi:MAG: hypothetical protein IJU53_10985, partial [Thermoguttaceae bacterium]|nr:hypothetical protein [Thermoguttaceae bacterium]